MCLNLQSSDPSTKEKIVIKDNLKFEATSGQHVLLEESLIAIFIIRDYITLKR